MKSKHMDPLSDKKWQNAMSDLRAEIAHEAWTGRKKTSVQPPAIYCTFEDFTRA